MKVLGPHTALPVQSVETVGDSRHPQVASGVLHNGIDHLSAVDFRDISEIVRIGVVILQTVHSADIQPAGAGHFKGEHIVAEKPVPV